jgi:hypothetical protein
MKLQAHSTTIHFEQNRRISSKGKDILVTNRDGMGLGGVDGVGVAVAVGRT